MSKASEIVAIALAQVGYKEKASNANLDSSTGNAGSGNWTKYARDLAAAGYYNGNKNGYAWCDVFVDWCFFKAYGKAEGQRIQCQTGTLGAACPYSAQYYKNKGRLDSTPRVGDQIFFQQNGNIVHTGLVVAVTGSSVTTVEGNSGDMVKKNTYSRSSSYISCYGHPLYDEVDEVDPAVVSDVNYGSELSVKLNVLSKGSKGPQVKTIQRIIYARGINKNISVDGEFGAVTKAGVVALQKQLFPSNSAEWDGEVGSKTWTAILAELN